MLAARAAYASPVLVRTGKTALDLKKDELRDVPVYADLAAFTDALLSGQLFTA